MSALFFCQLLVASLIPLSCASPVDSIIARRALRSAGDPVHITSDNTGIYTRVARMNDGSIIAGYTTQNQNNTVHILATSRSTDNGQSWGYLGEVYRGPVATSDIDNAMVIQLPSGRVLYAYRNHDRTGTGPNDHYTWFRISISYSDDGGKTFRFLSTVDERGQDPNTKNGLWEPYLRQAGDGSLQCYYSSENNNDDQDSLMKYSRDDGQTWSSPILVSGGGVKSRDGMQGVAPLDNNGTLISVFEETESGHFEISGVVSQDDGMSWSGRRKIYSPPRGASGAPQVCHLGDTTVVSFMTTEDHEGIDGGVDGGDMKVVISKDAGASWGPSTTTGPAPAHWPGLFTLDNTHIMALYSQDGQGALSQIYSLD